MQSGSFASTFSNPQSVVTAQRDGASLLGTAEMTQRSASDTACFETPARWQVGKHIDDGHKTKTSGCLVTQCALLLVRRTFLVVGMVYGTSTASDSAQN